MNDLPTNTWQRFLTQPWHWIGLIVFYILHEWLLNLELVAIFSLICIGVLLLVMGGLLYLFFKRKLKDTGKAAAMTTLTEFALLYFGTLEDSITNHTSIAFLGEVQVLLPTLIILLTLLYFAVKKLPRLKSTLHQYLNSALLLFIAFEVLAFVAGFDKARLSDITPNDLTFSVHGCDTCKKPPIFLVVMDEYTGTDGQLNYFGYDSKNFTDALTQKGFKVIPHARSNYIFTVFSMASFFNMQYLQDFGEHNAENTFSYQRSLRSIRKNLFVEYLLTQGYSIHNFSAFDLPGEAAKYHNEFLPRDWVLLLNETFYYRIMMVLPHFLAKKIGSPSMLRWINERSLQDNEELLDSAIPATITDTSKQFFYLHLMMPHAPYARNEKGEYQPLKSTNDRSSEKDSAYIHYLHYTNNRVIELVDHIQKATKGKAVILLLSDHGFRDEYHPQQYKELSYANFMSVYTPDRNYDTWSDSVTSVNTLRVLLNNQFHERIPLLKDSMVH